jgi:MFS family permease
VGLLAMAREHFVFVLVGVSLVKASQAIIIPSFRKTTMAHLGQFGEATAMSVVTTATMLGFAVLGPMFGSISDRYGLRFLLFLCLGTFVLGSITAWRLRAQET